VTPSLKIHLQTVLLKMAAADFFWVKSSIVKLSMETLLQNVLLRTAAAAGLMFEELQHLKGIMEVLMLRVSLTTDLPTVRRQVRRRRKVIR